MQDIQSSEERAVDDLMSSQLDESGQVAKVSDELNNRNYDNENENTEEYNYDNTEEYNYNKLYNAAVGYPTYEEIQYELDQYKEYSTQLNHSIEQRDVQINQQYHQIQHLKDENKKLKTKNEKQLRILKAKERSFKREKEDRSS